VCYYCVHEVFLVELEVDDVVRLGIVGRVDREVRFVGDRFGEWRLGLVVVVGDLGAREVVEFFDFFEFLLELFELWAREVCCRGDDECFHDLGV